MPRPKKPYRKPEINMSPMIDCVFLLLIFFILTIEMDETLDAILKLPPAYKSVLMEEDKLQIYILPAVIQADGRINPDSTGLIAFTPREPAAWDPRKLEERFISLDSVPERLKRERTRACSLKVVQDNNQRAVYNKPLMDDTEVKELCDEYPLMIKSDKNTFYGRILQVVAKARSIGIRNFVLVSANETSEDYVNKTEKVK